MKPRAQVWRACHSAVHARQVGQFSAQMSVLRRVMRCISAQLAAPSKFFYVPSTEYCTSRTCLLLFLFFLPGPVAMCPVALHAYLGPSTLLYDTLGTPLSVTFVNELITLECWISTITSRLDNPSREESPKDLQPLTSSHRSTHLE